MNSDKSLHKQRRVFEEKDKLYGRNVIKTINLSITSKTILVSCTNY